MSQEQINEATVRRWMDELWNQKHEAIIDELLSPVVIAHGMGPNGTELVGPEAFRAAFKIFSGAFPDLHISIDTVVASGDKVAAHLTCRGTHAGEHLGIAPTGRRVQFPAMTIARFRDGKVVEGWNVIDLLSVFRQVGASAVSEALP